MVPDNCATTNGRPVEMTENEKNKINASECIFWVGNEGALYKQQLVLRKGGK